MIKFAIIGAGWRSEFYLRIAELLPKDFKVSAIFIRNEKKAQEFKEKYDVFVVTALEDMLKTDFDFIVNCVNKDNIIPTINELCKRGYAVLSETPICQEVNDKFKVQVAEQFHFQPNNVALKKLIESGLFGELKQVKISACHDYHAGSLIRFFLDINDEKPKITEIVLNDEVTRYNSRQGFINPVKTNSKQKIRVFEYEGKSAIYDFNIEQYFSEIRQNQIILNFTNGQIVNDKCTYLKDGIPHSFNITRNQSGINENLDGFALNFITANGEVLYENPFKNARLSDEEIAIATCLVKMYEYTKTGKDFYPPSQALIDYKMFY